MAEKTVKSKAPWILNEIIPVIIVLLIGVGGLVAGATNVFNQVGSISTMVVGFGLALFLVYVNWKRKSKSTLVATLKNDDKYGIKVWMVSPNKIKWNGRLDESGKNSANLVGGFKVDVDNIQETKVLVFHVSKGKQFIIPVRFLRDNAEVALYLAEAKAFSKWQLTPAAQEIVKEYFPRVDTAELTGVKDNEAPAVVFADNQEEEDENVSEPVDAAWEEEVYGESRAQEEANKEYRVTQWITYPDIEDEKELGDQVSDAIDAHELKLAQDSEKETSSPMPDLYSLGSGSSISIDLGDVDKKSKS